MISVAVTDIISKSNFNKKEFVDLSSRKTKLGIQDKNQEAGTEADTMKHIWYIELQNLFMSWITPTYGR